MCILVDLCAEGAPGSMHIGEGSPRVFMEIEDLARSKEGMGLEIVASQGVDIALEIESDVLLADLAHGLLLLHLDVVLVLVFDDPQFVDPVAAPASR